MLHGQELSAAHAKVTEAGDSTPQLQRLRSSVALERVESVQALRESELVREIARPLVDLHRRVRPADESTDPSVIDPCRARDQVDEVPDHRMCHRRPLRVGQHHGAHRQTLILAQAFVGREKERAVPGNGAANMSPELVTLEGGLGARVERIARVERSVPEEFDHTAAELVRARTRDDVDAGSAVASVLDQRRCIVDPELLDRVDRRLKDEDVVELIVHRDAVHLEIRRALPVTRTVDRLASLRPRRRREGSTLRRCHGARREQGELKNLPAVEWTALQRALIDDLAQRNRVLDQRNL
jgi:hypothetical protein